MAHLAQLETQRAPEVAVVSPTYCEAENIGSLIQKIEGLNLNISILVIDDSSPDHTADTVRKLQGKYSNVLENVKNNFVQNFLYSC
jgi:glycosyltransferase involved in cell wall biosynthesis